MEGHLNNPQRIHSVQTNIKELANPNLKYIKDAVDLWVKTLPIQRTPPAESIIIDIIQPYEKHRGQGVLFYKGKTN